MLSKELQNKIAPHEPVLRQIATVAGIVTALVMWVLPMFKARGDFLLHWKFGYRLVHGTFLYAEGMHIPYPPSWAMLFAPFSFFPQRVAMPLFYVLGFCALLVLLKILHTLTRKHFFTDSTHVFWITAAVLVVLSRFVLRDLADGGENLFINTLTWSGLFFVIRRKPLPGGALLGLAIALKCTPVLFTGYFLLKRQWAAMFTSLAFGLLFFVTPVLFQGPKSYGEHITYWKNNVLKGISQTDPSIGVLGPEELHNKALKPMLARYLMRLPDGHPSRFNNAAYIDFLRLAPRTAGIIIKIITLLSGLGVVWFFSRSSLDLQGMTVLWECAIVSLLMLLFSPITWGEHCVAAIPALYLILLRMTSSKSFAPWVKWLFLFVVAILILLNRSIIGLKLSELLESYHGITFCLLALTVISLVFWRETEKTTATLPAS